MFPEKKDKFFLSNFSEMPKKDGVVSLPADFGCSEKNLH